MHACKLNANLGKKKTTILSTCFDLLCRYKVPCLKTHPMASLASLANVTTQCAGPLHTCCKRFLANCGKGFPLKLLQRKFLASWPILSQRLVFRVFGLHAPLPCCFLLNHTRKGPLVPGWYTHICPCNGVTLIRIQAVVIFVQIRVRSCVLEAFSLSKNFF